MADSSIDTLVVVAGLTGAGKTAVVRRLVSEIHLRAETTVKAVIINDGPVTGLDPQLSNLKIECKKLGVPAPKLVLGGACLCCDGGSEKLTELLLSFSSSPTAAASTPSSSSSGTGSSPASRKPSVLILELDGATSLLKLPYDLLSRVARRMVVVSVLGVGALPTHLSSLCRPLRATEPCADVVVQQIESADWVVTLSEEEGTPNRSGVLARELCAALNPRVRLLDFPRPNEEEANVPPANDVAAADAAAAAATAAAAPLFHELLTTMAAAAVITAPAENNNNSPVVPPATPPPPTPPPTPPTAVRRFEFDAARPFHPVKFVEWVVKRLPREDGCSAFKTLVEPPTNIGDVKASSASSQASLLMKDHLSSPSLSSSPSSASAASSTTEAAPGEPTSNQEGADAAAAPSLWSRCIRVSSSTLWLASQPQLHFSLSFSGCHTKLDELPKEIGNAATSTSTSSISLEEDPPLAAAASPELAPVQARTQRITVVYVQQEVEGDEEEEEVKERLKFCLDACLLNDEELVAYHARALLKEKEKEKEDREGKQTTTTTGASAASVAAAAVPYDPTKGMVSSSSLSPPPRQCGSCGRGPEKTSGLKLRPCPKCKLIFYCGEECQRAHWKAGHKTDCASKKLKAAGADLTASS